MNKVPQEEVLAYLWKKNVTTFYSSSSTLNVLSSVGLFPLETFICILKYN